MRLPLALALVVAGLAHATAVGNGFTNWDDPGYLLHNRLTEHPLAEGVGGLLTTRSLAYPIPVTVLAYAGQRAAFGLAPQAYHLVSLALHLLCVALVACLAARLGARRPGPTGMPADAPPSGSRRSAGWGAAGAAALFGVHPVLVEPVAWVVGQKDLLAAALVLAALLVRVRSARAGASGLTLLLAVLAIGAKPSSVAIAAILPALDAALGRRIDRAAIGLYAGCAVMAALSIRVGLVGHGFVGGEPPAAFGARSLAEALWAVWLHARHLVWPDPLLARYFPPDGAALVAGAAAGAIAVAALVAAAALSWRRGRREVAFGLAAALLAYLPVSGLVPLSRGAADSYLYLPLALAALAVARGLDRLAARPKARAAAAAVVLLAAALGAASARQGAVWRDAIALWQPVARAYPDEPRALMRLADAALWMERPAEALASYDAIRRRFPSFATSLPAHAAALQALGRDAEAEPLLAEAVHLDPGRDSLETYGFFLASHDVAPSDERAARPALIAAGRLLAERGKRPATVERAARLLRGYGENALAEALDRRLAELRARR
jgi:tetratricopeptide (TPR) repeat protein